MAEKQLWLEPDYFADFHCKGGACRNSCCSGWDIAVSMNDYFRLIGLDCDPELHHRLECAFRTPEFPEPARYRLISPNWLGQCPLQDKDGLCALHRACGEGALPEICRVYPRSFKREGKNLQACCSASCEAVVEQLMAEDQLSFRLMEMEAKVEIGEDAAEDVGQTIRGCVAAIQNRDQDLHSRVAKICAALAMDKTFVSGPEALEILMNALSEMRSESRNLCEYGAAAFGRYLGKDAWAQYDADRNAFAETYPDWMRIFENVLANHIVYADFPYADPRLKPADAAAGLCLLYSAMLALSAAHTCARSDENALADALAGLFHLAEHSAFYYNARVLTKGALVLV